LIIQHLERWKELQDADGTNRVKKLLKIIFN